MDSSSYQRALKRGFAVVRGPGGLLTRAAQVSSGLALDIEFGDGHAAAVGAGDRPAAGRKPKSRRAKPPPGDDPQGSLL